MVLWRVRVLLVSREGYSNFAGMFSWGVKRPWFQYLCNNAKYFLHTVSVCSQNIFCLKTGAFPGEAGADVAQVLSRGWVLARQLLSYALQQRGSWPGECSPQGNLRDVKGCCWWILKEGFYCSGIFSVYFSWWHCVLMCCWRSAEGPETWTFLEFKVLAFQDFHYSVSLSAVSTSVHNQMNNHNSSRGVAEVDVRP